MTSVLTIIIRFFSPCSLRIYVDIRYTRFPIHSCFKSIRNVMFRIPETGLISVARLGVFPLDLGDFWSFSGKFRGRNSLVGKFSGFFFIQGFL